jgi:chromosome segregation ATPase
MEKLKPENITLKADSIIYREDISNLVQSNDKYSQDLENARKKIMELIEKCNEIEKEINHKEFQIEKLNEILARLRLYENQDYEFKIKNDKSKEEVLNEIENNVKIEKEGNNKLIQNKKILEEKIQNLIQNRNDFNRNNLFNSEKENKIINELEEKIKFLEKSIINLNEENNMLNETNTKMKKELDDLGADRNNYEEKYNKEKEDLEKLKFFYNNLYNKYQNTIIENNKKLMKKEEIRRNKSEKKLQKNKSVINELYNKIQILKSKVKKDRNFEN